MLSFRHKAFLEVARNLSFSKASQLLFISQPATSKHIKALEETYLPSLFELRGNSIKLTETGKILYGHLLKAKSIEKQLEFEISTIKDSNAMRS